MWNAFTGDTETGYYFGIEQKNLTKVLDRFVNLFVEPSLDLADIEGEREAVDSGRS